MKFDNGWIGCCNPIVGLMQMQQQSVNLVIANPLNMAKHPEDSGVLFSMYTKFSKDWIGWAAEAMKPGAAMWVVARPYWGWHIHRAMVRSSLKPIQKVVALAPETDDEFDEDAPLACAHFEIYLGVKYDGTLSIRPTARAWTRDVWRLSSSGTPTPEDITRTMIEMSSKEGDVVLDPFMGRGSTLKTGLLLGRNVVGFEQSPGLYSELIKLVSKAPSTACG